MNSSIEIKSNSIGCIVATLGRSDELKPLLSSLASQTHVPDEVIIVDQNGDDRLAPILASFEQKLPVKHLHLPTLRGVNNARNEGLSHASSDVVIFPDDDCWYPDDFIEHGLQIMKEQSAEIVSGRAADKQGNDVNGNFQPFASWVDRQNIWQTQIEWVVFAKRSLLNSIQGYDPNLGVGAYYGSCEGQDVSLRAIASGARQYYDPSLYGFHKPFDRGSFSNEALYAKARTYGRGMGYVQRIHNYSNRSAATWVAKSLARLAIAVAKLDFRDAGYYWNTAMGRFEGYFVSRKAM